MTMNILASQNLLHELGRLGVEDVVICAGARNSPLVAVLERARGVRVHSYFEERSAAFFALGRARRDHRPTAVITTSGTAAAQLLPAAIEAFHTGVPLILVTADRPRRLRGTGAPQAIDQTGLFAKFVELEIDLEAGEELAPRLAAWTGVAPLHLNFCLDEPLLDGPLHAWQWPQGTMSAHRNESGDGSEEEGQTDTELKSRLTAFFARAAQPVAIVGTLTTPSERAAVEEFLVRLGCPVYLEATSGLRESTRLAQQALRSGDKVLSWALRLGHVDGVLRIGGIPTVRIWRDLDLPTSRIDVLSISRWPFAGLSRGEFIAADPARMPRHDFKTCASAQALLERDRLGQRHLAACLEREPTSEPALVHALSRLIPTGATTYLGNSLPIREWDLAAAFESANWVRASRGVNGIDGQMSTFFGHMSEHSEGWCVLGDLTTLYDLTAPWAFHSNSGLRARLVVINNGGGKIFSRLFGSPLFENRHGLGFSAWAAMWGLDHETWTQVPREWRGSDRVVIEIRPDEGATERFWNAYDAFWAAP
ncbi:MAG: 2-succinyl-5-enolpyruvyl-6-hydroxy-3-cyclohexene-1-carboxylic-acid synthase [Bdellovibrionaceae bacterium]|nr:2-succinyl-5-enolpyruvyl-6-hydroxy-3-cyclohexene-1-carboxylic-acid synthase [Pseudobdellovibrionaceae bacterium]